MTLLFIASEMLQAKQKLLDFKRETVQVARRLVDTWTISVSE